MTPTPRHERNAGQRSRFIARPRYDGDFLYWANIHNTINTTPYPNSITAPTRIPSVTPIATPGIAIHLAPSLGRWSYAATKQYRQTRNITANGMSFGFMKECP